MSLPEALAEEFSNSSVQNAFSDFLAETKPDHEAGRKSLARSFQSVDNLIASHFSFEGTLCIDCHASGELRSQTGTLIVGEAADIQANIFVATAIVNGVLHGDLSASERVELGSKARVVGNIETPSISIQPGALFNGQCHFLRPTDERNDGQTKRSRFIDLKSREILREPDLEEKPRAMSAVASL